MRSLLPFVSVALLLAACDGVPVSGLPEHPDAGLQAMADGGLNAPADGGDQPDASTVPADGGQEEFDAGPTSPDAGPPPFDAGPIDVVDAGADLGDSVPNSPPACTSGVSWLLGDLGTELMHPGRACINCHSMHNAPHYTFAGTVYPTTHEPDDCNGLGSGWSVLIIDAAGKQITLTPNLVGSFHSSETFTPPYTAQVIAGGRTRTMLDTQTSGDCNSCHTQNGASSAPGRIVAP